MLENVVDNIISLQSVKTYFYQFKVNTGTDLTYEKYYGILILDATPHDKNKMLSLLINTRGIPMRLNNSPMMRMRFNVTYNPLLIQSKHMLITKGRFIQ